MLWRRGGLWSHSCFSVFLSRIIAGRAELASATVKRSPDWRGRSLSRAKRRRILASKLRLSEPKPVSESMPMIFAAGALNHSKRFRYRDFVFERCGSLGNPAALMLGQDATKERIGEQSGQLALSIRRCCLIQESAFCVERTSLIDRDHDLSALSSDCWMGL
jgi:hypothetical protein